jgi:hypothetical protein
VTSKVTQTELVMQGSYTSKKVTSKLHKSTSYKSNYTSTMYMKAIASLCKGIANQWKDKDDMMIFIPRFTWLSPS